MDLTWENISAQEIEEYQKNSITQLIVETLKERLEIVRVELELGYVETGGEKVPLDYGSLRERQGECISIRYKLNLLENLKNIKIESENKTKENKDA